MMSPGRLCLTFILFCSFLPRTEAASTFTIDRFQLQESLDAHSEMLLSPSEEVADVLALSADSWRPVSDELRYAQGSSVIWLKTTVENRLQVPVQVTLRLQTSLFSSARFFVLNQSVLTEQTHASGQTPAWLALGAMRPSHSLTLEPGASRLVLLGMQSEAPHDPHWEIWDTESHRRESFQSMLRWTFLLATLLLLAIFACVQGFAQKRGILLALALNQGLALLFLVRMTHWPLLTMFWEPLAEALPPLNHIHCALIASGLILLRYLSRDLPPQRLLQRLFWSALAFLVLDLSLIAVLHHDQSLIFLLPGGLLFVGCLAFFLRCARRENHSQRTLIGWLLGQQLSLFTLHLLILIDSFPLAWLPEFSLWIQVITSATLLFLALPSYHAEAKDSAQDAASSPDLSPARMPEKSANLLHEQWLHAEKMAALGTFTNGLANELNNPLAIIAGHRFRLSSMIDSRSFNIHEFEKSLGKIDQAVNRMIAVIDALKVYSQDPEGQELLKTFSVRETIKYTIDLCRDKVVSRGIKLITPELGDATMEGHQGQIIQVLLILVDNAIDALDHASEKSIRIELQPLPDSVRIAVMDSGPGVPLGIRNKIWDPFFTSKDPFRHKGLGLSIASGIISNHRGQLLLDESTPETRFVVELPRTRRPLGLPQTDSPSF
jgi:signal transduction histidine kinase